jgi:hypothetical protein
MRYYLSERQHPGSSVGIITEDELLSGVTVTVDWPYRKPVWNRLTHRNQS